MTASTQQMLKFGVGASALRKEDLSLLTGKGQYTDDMSLPGQCHGFVVRSPYAAAKFTITDTASAEAAPGVKLVLTAADLAGLGPVKNLITVTQPDGTRHEQRHIPLLCDGEVRYVGDAIAFIVADTRAQAEDAAELLEVDWSPEDVIATLGTALDADAAKVWPELGTNRAYEFELGDAAAVSKALETAAHRIEVSVVNNRLVSNYLETRAALADWDSENESWTLWCPSQGVHSIRGTLARDIFGVAPEAIRVVTGDVGGGFGTKTFNYREYPLAMEASRRLNCPVKWASSRTEHFLTDAQGRASLATAEAAVDEDGRITALQVRMTANMGGYLSQFGPLIPTMAAIMLTGVYDIQLAAMHIDAVYTHTAPVDAYRGAGRPEAAYLIERLMDAAARKLGMSPVEFRRRNFIPVEKMPYKTAGGRLYDTGEFDGHLTKALELADWDGIDLRVEEARSRGKIRGQGLATYVEACAFAGSEPAHLHLNEDGTITLFIGTQTNGQGHATAYSQFIAEKIGIDFDRIIVRQGDTKDLKSGGGTGGSRSIPLGGVSVSQASDDLASKMKRIAAEELEAAPEDIELVSGEARVVGTDRALDYAGVAKAAKSADDRIAIAEIKQDEATYPNGTHAVEVEIDPETGEVEIVNYQIVDDFGMTVNPLLLSGQIHGGAVQGIGQALLEDTVYDADGQLLTASLMDYALPRADNMPSFKFETRNVPSTTNALGIKGAGEAATIGATPAVVNAVIDALHRAYGIEAVDMPLTPQKIWAAIKNSGQA